MQEHFGFVLGEQHLKLLNAEIRDGEKLEALMQSNLEICGGCGHNGESPPSFFNSLGTIYIASC